ncbi:hypothetical protein PG985_009973 [Apiospora marii]|uniref:Uncharacterized protein n=1 Tax=Apiospora marii TaxID=335849 RepID=A0ABR1RLM5_9PEZI
MKPDAAALHYGNGDPPLSLSFAPPAGDDKDGKEGPCIKMPNAAIRKRRKCEFSIAGLSFSKTCPALLACKLTNHHLPSMCGGQQDDRASLRCLLMPIPQLFSRLCGRE